MIGTIFDIKEMAVHDGPGLRTTVFFKGCPLRCRWCHNPEGLSPKPQLMVKEARCRRCGACRIHCAHPECQPFGRCLRVCPENCLELAGRQMEVSALAAELLAGAAVLGDAFGGFTFSGGEPLAQPQFLLALADALKPHHLCIETCGYAEPAVFQKAVEALDYIIMDLKLADPRLHKQYTGVDNRLILQNFAWLRQSGKPYTVRTPLIPGITDTPENLAAIAALIGDAPWEKLPYNAAAGAKYQMLGMEYPMKGTR
ncbi:MAG: glycyl-radical enzyme activating protein [Clostridia bacterium]|nr:glycyl-radical enzyme activating protein [Clostridia bacterium]